MSRPLTVLLAQAITIEARVVDARTGVPGSLAAWATVLQHIGDGGGRGDDGRVDVRSMPARSCLSKRALQTGYTVLTRLGLVVVEPGVARGEKFVRLTPAGAAAVDGWRPASSPFESAPLRDALVTIVGGLALEHPHFPTQYGTADASITGGPGQDWKPVVREGASGVPSLPMVALLSQAFCALAIDYERTNGALGWASVLAVVPDEGLPIEDLPRWSRLVTGGMERHGRLRVASGRVTLTPLGAAMRDRHARTLASVESGWRERYGDRVVDELSSSLAAGVSATGVGVADVHHPPTHALFGRHVA